MADWSEVAAGAAAEAGDLDATLLGDFLPVLALACADGRRLDRHGLAEFRTLGARAADEGVALPALIDLYLSAAWRAWRLLPAVAGSDAETVRTAGGLVLHAVDDVVAAVTDGFRAARRAAVRLEESDRRAFVDDLLAGTGDPIAMLGRAERFGFDPTGPHAVLVAEGLPPVNDNSPLVSQVASAAPDALVVTRHGAIVVIIDAPPGGTGASGLRTAVGAIGEALGHEARLGVGLVQPGVAGIARSYTEAAEVLGLADRIGRTERILFADQLLIFRVLIRDRPAMLDLIDAVLEPLRGARGGAGPLLDTIEAFVATGGTTTATARRLHLSARAVTYRLGRVRDLTGRDPTDPEDRFVLYAALLGARALGWPDEIAESRQLFGGSLSSQHPDVTG